MKFRDLHLNVKIRLLEDFVNSMLGNMIFPFMVIYFSQHFGPALTGILMTVNVILGMIANLYGGFISDKLGRKKVMMIAQIFFFASYLIMALANSPLYESPILTFLMTSINGICWGIMKPAGQAMLIDVTTTENRKFVFGINYWLFNIAFAISGVAGGFLFQSYLFELLLILAFGALVSLFLLVFLIEETYFPNKDQQHSSKGFFREIGTMYRSIIGDKIFMVYVLGLTLLASIEIQSRNYSAVRLVDDFGVQSLFGIEIDGVKIFGLLTSESAVLVVLLGLFTAKVLNKFRELTALTVAVLLSSVGFAMIAFVNSPWLLLVSMAIATVGEVVWVPIVQSLAAELPDNEKRSSYMAVMSISYGAKMAIGSLAVTLGTYVNSYVMGGVIFVTGMISLAVLGKIVQHVQFKKRFLEQNAEIS